MSYSDFTLAEVTRRFGLTIREGANLFAANYTDSTVTQFAVDPETGALTFTGNRTEVPFPFAIAISA